MEPEATATTTPTGALTTDQIAALKVQFPRGVQELLVTTATLEVVAGYIQKPNRNVVGIALTKTTKGDVLGAGEFLLTNCLVGGDPRMNPNSAVADDDIIIAASLAVAKSVEVLDAEIKKL